MFTLFESISPACRPPVRPPADPPIDLPTRRPASRPLACTPARPLASPTIHRPARSAMPTPIQSSDLTKSIPVNPSPTHRTDRLRGNGKPTPSLQPKIAYKYLPSPCGDVGICDTRVCVLFVPSRSDIVFNPIVSVITDKSRSAEDIDQYF